MTEPHPLHEGGNPHGKVSSWIVVAVAILSFAVGGGALILGMWLVVYICAGIFVLTVPAGMLVGVMEDTVQWVTPEPGRRAQQLAGEEGNSEEGTP